MLPKATFCISPNFRRCYTWILRKLRFVTLPSDCLYHLVVFRATTAYIVNLRPLLLQLGVATIITFDYFALMPLLGVPIPPAVQLAIIKRWPGDLQRTQRA